MEIISASDIELIPFQTSDDGIDDVKQFWKDAESFYDNLQFQTGQRDDDIHLYPPTNILLLPTA